MKEVIKKYWFVGIISIIFLVGIVFVVVNNQQHSVSKKTVDGKDVLFTIGDLNKPADEVYAELSGSQISLIAMKFEDMVVTKTVELTEDELTQAKLNAQATLANYKAQFGDEKVAVQKLEQALKGVGYQTVDDLQTYFANQTRKQNVLNKTILLNPEVFNKFQSETQARFVSHILINSTTETASPEVQEKMNKVDEALKTKSFADVAKEFSEDSTAANGGVLPGITTNKTNFVPEFLQAALALKEHEVSGWVKSQYGYHKIMMTDSSLETMSKDAGFLEAVLTYDHSLYGKTFMDLAATINVEFTNDDVKKALMEFYQLGQ